MKALAERLWNEPVFFFGLVSAALVGINGAWVDAPAWFTVTSAAVVGGGTFLTRGSVTPVRKAGKYERDDDALGG